MTKLSENALWTFQRLYFNEGETKPIQTFRRVANSIVNARPDLEKYRDEFVRIQAENKFRVNTPCYMNLGCNRKQITAACYVGNLEDSMDSINKFFSDATQVFLAGAGIGANFSDLRERDCPLSSGGTSSGPIAFMKHLNSLGGTIKSGGKTRRAAIMIMFDVTHPDVLDVITLKTRESLENANISINLTDDFMKCVQEDGMWETIGFKDGKVKSKVKARQLLNLIATCAHACGDPGVAFLDRANRFDTIPSLGKIRSTNPCVTGDTLVAVADGRGCVPIQRLAEEGKDVLVHCCNPKTGESYVRMGRNPRKTREKAQVLKVTLGDGSSIRTTYDHKFILRDGSEIEAKDLRADMTLMPFVEECATRTNYNHTVAVVEPDGVADVYNITVDEFHTVAYVTNPHDLTTRGKRPKHTGIITKNCGEQILHAHGACNLGSINIGAHVENGAINWQDLETTIRVAVRCLDGMIDASAFPTEDFEKIAKLTRNIGLGLMGLADTFLMLNLPYDTAEARELAGKIMSFITNTAWDESRILAEENEPFPLWSEPENQERLKEIWGIENPVRNAQITTIAPTGTTSISCDCSSGMEPLFAIVYEKRISDTGDIMTFVHPEFEKKYAKESWYNSKLINEIKRKMGSIQKIDGVPPEVKRLWKTAHDIHWRDRVLMQSELQKWVTSSISSTVNLPSSATVDDIYQIICFTYEQGLKGVTVYRDGCKANQPIKFGATTAEDQRFQRPKRLYGFTESVKTGLGTMYVTINTYDSRPIECFVEIGKSGGNKKADAEAVGRLVSCIFRLGGSCKLVYDQLIGIAGKDITWSEGRQVLSIYDALAKVLWDEYINPDRDVEVSSYEECPHCRGRYIHKEGCAECLDCGFSKCA